MESFILHIIFVIIICEVVVYLVVNQSEKYKAYRNRILQVLITTALIGILVAVIIVEDNNSKTENLIEQGTKQTEDNNNQDSKTPEAESNTSKNNEKSLDKIHDIKPNPVEQRLDEQQQEIEEIKKPEIEKMPEDEWIASRLNEFKQELVDKELIENSISIVINGNTLKLPFYGKDLTAIGVDDTSETSVPPMAEAYGRIRKLNGRPLELTYLSMSSITTDSDNCIVNEITISNKDASLRFNGGQEIQVGTSLEDVVKALDSNNYPLQYFGASDKIKIDNIEFSKEVTGDIDKCCSININNKSDNFSIRLNTYNVIEVITPEVESIPMNLRGKASEEIRHFEYSIEGTVSEGVKTISMSCNAINTEVLSYRHDLLLKNQETSE